MSKKLLFGGGIILSFFCIVSVQISSNSPSTAKAQIVQGSSQQTRSFLPQSVNSSIPDFSYSAPISSQANTADYVEGEVIIKYKKTKINLETTVGLNKAKTFNATKNTTQREFLKKGNLSVIKINDNKTVEQKIAELRADPNIEYAEPNYRRYPSVINTNDTHKDLLWGLDNTGQAVGGTYPDSETHTGTADADMDVPEAWAISEATTSNEVIVAVIDSGVAYNHPDLADNMWDGTNCKDEDGNFLGGCNHGYDFYSPTEQYYVGVSGDKTPLPSGIGRTAMAASSHGTHVAGIIAGVKNNGKGIIGIAPNVKIMALKFGLDSASEVRAIDFAIQNGAKVINASYGGRSFSQAEMDAIARFGDAGGIFVAAAGNDSLNLDSPLTSPKYPAMYNLDNIISVAATDQNNQLASFSNFGRTYVDVGAPGTNIFSTLAEIDAVDEGYEGVVAPALPAGWITGGSNNRWVTNYTNETWGNVLWAQYPGLPYDGSVDTTITSPAYDLSSGVTGANLSFYAVCDTEYSGFLNGGYNGILTDYMSLEYSSDGVNFYPATSTFFTGGILRWNEQFLRSLGGTGDADNPYSTLYFRDLVIPSQYFTSSFKIRFRWRTNATDNNYNGCLIDDVKLTKFNDGSDETYGYMSGTSMSTPYVAGLAALIKSYSTNLASSEVKSIILNKGEHGEFGSLSVVTVSGKIVNAGASIQYLEPQKKIISFSFASPLTAGVIDEVNYTISVNVPFGTDITNLTPTIAIEGESISPSSGVAQNFTDPVTYSVTASNGLKQDYFVTVNISAATIENGANAIGAIGQYQDETASPLIPNYIKGKYSLAGSNNGPNRLGLRTPLGGAMDEVHHRFFISDHGNNRVLVYNLNSDNTFTDYIPDNVLGQSDYANNSAGTTQNTLNGPAGLAYDSVGDRLFVSDMGDPYNSVSNNRIMIFNVSTITNGENAINVLGQNSFTGNTPGTTQNTLNGPSGLVFDEERNLLFVADSGVHVNYSGGYTGNSRIMIFNVATTTDGENAVNVLGQNDFNTKTGNFGQNRLRGASGIAYDVINKRLFVADSANNRVMIFDLSTITDGENAVNVLGQINYTARDSGGDGSSFWEPKGLVYDYIDNRLFVSDFFSRILIFDVSSSTISNGKSAANALGISSLNGTTYIPQAPSQSRFTGAHQLVYDATNKLLFVPDTKFSASASNYSTYNNNRVLIFNVASSTFVNGQNAVGLIGQYQDETVQPLIPDYTKGKADNDQLFGYNNGPNKLGLNMPTNIYLDKINHKLYIADYNEIYYSGSNDRTVVHNLSSDNTLIDYVPDEILGISAFPTSTNAGLDPIGHRLFSVDTANHRVLVYNLNSDNTLIDGVADNVLGQPDLATVTSGTTQAKLKSPASLVYDPYSHRLFVADSSNYRIMVFDVANVTNGENAVNVFGSSDFTTSGLITLPSQNSVRKPNGLTYDPINKYLYVADTYNNRIMIFNATPEDQTAPTSTSFSPANNATGTSKTVNLGLSFSDPIYPGDGDISIYRSNGVVFEIIPATSTNITGYGTDTITINPTGTLTEKSSYYIQIDSDALADVSGNNFLGVNDSDLWNFTVGDFTSPIIIDSSPTGELNYGTTSTTVSIETDEPAICKYSTSPGASYAAMTEFESTGAIIHLLDVSSLTDGSSYDYYAKCQDYGNLESTETHISFSIGTRTIVIPTISNLSPSGEQSAGTTQVTLTASTDQNANCKYSSNSGASFGSMTVFTTTGEREHSTVVSGLTSGTSYNYYVKCQNLYGDESAESSITFSIASPPPSSGGGNPVITPPPSTGTGGSDVVASGVGSNVNVGPVTPTGVNIMTYVTNLNNFTVPESSHGGASGSHSFQITNLDLTKKIATITFHSDPITVTLAQGETQAIDLDGDGKNDINVTFAGLNSNRAEITLKSLASTGVIIGEKPVITPSPQGQIIKINAKDRPAVYYISGGKKYSFVNRGTYSSWSQILGDSSNNFSILKQISQADFDSYLFGGNLTLKPGSLVKFTDSSAVYGVGADAKLYQLANQATQTKLYGNSTPVVIQGINRSNYFNNGNPFAELTAESVKPE